MKKSILFLSLSAFAFAASATNYGNQNEYNTYNVNPSAASLALAGAAAISSSKATALGGTGGNVSGVSGGTGGVAYGGAAGAGGSVGNVTGVAADAVKNNINVEGAKYERNVPPAIAPNVPLNAKSCRLYLSIAGSVSSGAGAGGIPIGNDQTCLAVTKLEVMESMRIFTMDDKLTVACGIEGMEETATCQTFKKK